MDSEDTTSQDKIRVAVNDFTSLVVTDGDGQRDNGGPIAVAEVAVPLPCIVGREARQYIPTVPIPLFRKVCQLGSAGFVFLLIWWRAKMAKSNTVSASTALLQEFGFSRKVKCRALAVLEEAGLIQVGRQNGKNPQVTLTACSYSAAPCPSP